MINKPNRPMIQLAAMLFMVIDHVGVVFFPDIEAALYLRLDETNLNPKAVIRTLNYWRDKGQLKATKYARRVWYLKSELNVFLQHKTEHK